MKRYLPFLLVIPLILSLLNLPLTLFNADAAEYFNNAYRTLEGDLPYRDFWLIFPPGEVYLPAFLFRLFGPHLVVLLFSQAALALLIAALVYRLSRSLLAASLSYFTAVISPYTLLSLLASYLLLNTYYFLPGLLLGLSFWFRLYESAAVTLALILFLLLTRRLNHLPRFLLGISLPLLAMVFIFRSILPEMLYQLFIQSLAHGNTWHLPYGNNLLAALQFLFDFLQRPPYSGLRFAAKLTFQLTEITGLLGLYLLPLTTVIFALKNIKNHKVLLFLLLALSLFPRALGRGDLAHLGHALPALLVLSSLLPARKFLKFNLLLAAFFLFALTIQLTSPIFQTRYSLSSPHGTLQTKNLSDYQTYQPLLNFISRNTAPTDTIFSTLWEAPPLYALTARRNPTYYDSLIDLLAVPDPAKEARLCDQLTSNPPALLIHNPNGGIVENHQLYSYRQLTPLLNDCIATHFLPLAQRASYTLYVPR